MKYEIYRDAKNDWRWRFVTNGRTIADSGQGYSNRSDAQHGIDLMKSSASAPVEQPPKGLLES